MHVSATDWATIATAAFAALAAGASWATVAQARRERRAAQTPDLHIEVVGTMGGGATGIRIHIVNAGGIAKLVKFAVLVGNQLATGHPPPVTMFRPGESRILETKIAHTPNTAVTAAFVTGYNARGDRFYVCFVDPKMNRTYKLKDLAQQPMSDDTLMQELVPAFNINAVTLVGYETTERNL